MSPQDVLEVLRRVWARGRDAAPEAWRQDRVFRYAAIGVGITAALLLLRLVGSDASELHAPPRVLLPERSGVTGPGVPSRPRTSDEPEIPRIAPGQSLDAITVAPAGNGDRFGSLKPGSHP